MVGLMLYSSSYNQEKRILRSAHPNIHIVYDIIEDDWAMDYFEGGMEESRMIMNKSLKKPQVTPFISSGLF